MNKTNKTPKKATIPPTPFIIPLVLAKNAPGRPPAKIFGLCNSATETNTLGHTSCDADKIEKPPVRPFIASNIPLIPTVNNKLIAPKTTIKTTENNSF